MSIETKLHALANQKATTNDSKRELSSLLRYSERLIDKLITYNNNLAKSLRLEKIKMKKRLDKLLVSDKLNFQRTKLDIQKIEQEIADLLKENQYLRKEIKSIRNALKRVKSIDHSVKKSYINIFKLLKTIDDIPEDKKLKYAKIAGIGEEYYSRMTLRQKPNGIIHIYYGGSDSPTGEGHGHCVIDKGVLIYKREPFKTRGRHNHIGPGREQDGGFDSLILGYLDEEPITYAWGWGSKKGYTILARGHLTIDAFRSKKNHQVFLPGEGPVANRQVSRLSA